MIGVAKAFATLLQAMEMRQQAYDVFEFIRDVCEETYNYKPLLDVYYRMSILLKKMGEYENAVVATKKML